LWATLWYPWTVVINLLALVGAAFGREIIWRGVEYIMVSRTKTVVRRPHAGAPGGGGGSGDGEGAVRGIW